MDNNLLIEQKMALDEYNILEKRIHATEEILTKWENVYLVVNGFLVALAGQAISKEMSSLKSQILCLILSLLGIMLCLNWTRVVNRTLAYILAREARHKLIEKFLTNNMKEFSYDENKYIPFDISEGTKIHLQKYINTSWRNNKSTFVIRRSLPEILMVIWSLSGVLFLVLGILSLLR